MNLNDIIEREELELDRKRLNSYQKNIKKTFEEGYDELFKEFTCKNSLTEEELELLKKYTFFLKEKA